MAREIIRARNFGPLAAQLILDCAHEALGDFGHCRIGLSGGNTPRSVYSELARRSKELQWDKVTFTFGDERCVPPGDPESNYKMARESLFQPGGVPDKSVIRMRGEIDPQLAAQEYEDSLAVLATQHQELTYRHDVLLLGVGDDGHTASLFPGTSALEETSRSVVANFVARMDAWRITFTLPLINQARKIIFLAKADKNLALLDAIMGGDTKYPAARVAPVNGQLTWLLAES
ncbi:MAG TPA: 6-phosphogluconolactonase [Chthoniobacterales bacterium]|jgi:6-phosphogluconolactonase|nr:6-phosphogluconolactonase [Chthoniobacterales bacterium]